MRLINVMGTALFAVALALLYLVNHFLHFTPHAGDCDCGGCQTRRDRAC